MSAQDAFVFRNATVLDGTESMEPRIGQTVLVEDGRIVAVGPASEVDAPMGARELDLGGAYLLPGLINMHVHLCGSGRPASAGDAGTS